VRVATKKLRYGLEVAHEMSGVPTTSLVRRLKRVQDLLGLLHDLEMLAAYVGEEQLQQGADDAALAAELRELVETLQDEIRALHARYLGSRAILLDVATATMRQIVPGLSTPSRIVASLDVAS
jgi:CHAD domain-containing protein